MAYIENKRTNEGGKLQLMEHEEELGFITYAYDGKKRLRVEHTVVDPAHKGKGYGKMLLKAIMALAEEENLEIVPVCSFVARHLPPKVKVEQL